jgi:hypothetical protein
VAKFESVVTTLASGAFIVCPPVVMNGTPCTGGSPRIPSATASNSLCAEPFRPALRRRR